MNELDMTASARAAIDAYIDPHVGNLGMVQAIAGLAVTASEVRLSLRLPIPVGRYVTPLQAALQTALERAGLVQRLVLDLIADIPARAVQKPLKPMPGIHNIIAVGSAKGGVGKSTVAANLALAWAAMGARVGVLDADIYGPSQPLLLGVGGQRPETVENKRILPLQASGVKLMSIGLLIDAGAPAIWRGPMVTQALTQLLADTVWGELDYLVIDLPPGTGDLQLTLAQKVPVAGAVVVTTPQEMAVADARKGLRMFEKMSIAVLGVVENMSTHVCSNCGHEEAIFGDGGGARLAEEAGVALLGRLPLDSRVRAESDSGRPTVVAAPDSPRGQAYFDLALRTAAELARRPRDRSNAFPGIVVERAS
jgi:ATP-binding protein involved in chromosome partitioning